MPKEIQSAAEFDRELGSAGSKLVVVDFHATWCGPCHAIAPTFASLSTKHASGAVFLKVDVDNVKEIAQRYSIRAMPTFIFIKNRSVIETIKGADPSKLSSTVQKHASASAGSFGGSGSTLGGGSSSSTPRATGGNNVHGLGDRNIKLETVLPIVLLGAYLFYILYGSK
ncbi:unnamed protein product [Tilletia controversa]|uniref:Thioredoxin n=3 Tax=Tilletia TaxID=13289 RepID=A0A8X7MY01_9BASI|nr:hypothetical protein CF336_g2350 [Tilletia laevis]KAE8202489.1 hypothetical protein CF328_g2185 [Tilletia controversa]KAE8263668.1 hypothetical protein A4X03_0g1514 [Tilletia caries]KAE8206910.1 hypothetical protein CF335_g1529 [Tilletia laevis]KAE8252299.1 hypothetical protein A4X06_0g2289 [Tilletia controversa]